MQYGKTAPIGTALLLAASAIAQAEPSKELEVYKGNLGKF